MKIVKKIAVLLLVVFIGMQFYRPEKNTTEDANHLTSFISDTKPSEEVELLLQQSCYDCHSNQTIYPWYNNIAPVSYWLADHIDHGKGHLNFSEWDTYTAKKKDHKLEEVAEMIEDGEMPLNEYTWTHAEANLTDAQKQAIVQWVQNTRKQYQSVLKPE